MSCFVPLRCVMSRLRWATRSALGLGIVVSAPVAAQRPVALAIDATVGGSQGHGGEFWDRGLAGARFAITVRGGGMRTLVPYGEAAIDWLSITMGHDLLCVPSSRGGCMDPYPGLRGPTISFGLLARPRRRIELRGGVGGGAYEAEGTRVGAITANGDIAGFIVGHVGVVIGTRLIIVPRYRGDRLWTNPWAIGVRIR